MKTIFSTRTLPGAALVSLLPAIAAGQSAWQAGRLTISAPAPIATIDDVKGEPSRLAWSPDGSQVYLQTLEGAFGKPGAKLRHYVISTVDGRKRDVDAEPEWAAPYWSAKSGQASPDDPSFRIEIKSEQRAERATSMPTGGDLARGGVSDGTGSSVEEGAAAAFNSQIVFTNSMLLKGETIGVFENRVIVPGLTFGWGPAGSKVIAFASKSGRVVAMDATGAKQEISGSKNAMLPAWSADGSKLAWLQREGKRKVSLQVSSVSRS